MIQRQIQASVLALIVAIPVAIAKPGATDSVLPAIENAPAVVPLMVSLPLAHASTIVDEALRIGREEDMLPLDEFAAINAIKSAGYYPEPLEPNEAWRDSHL